MLMSQRTKSNKVPNLVKLVPGSLALTVLLIGCSNLQPVAEFGKNASAIAGYPEVAADYPASLERQKLYEQTGPSVSDEAIAARQMAHRRRPRQTSDRLPVRAYQILQVLAHRLFIAKVMILLHQAVEERLVRGASYGLNLDPAQRTQRHG